MKLDFDRQNTEGLAEMIELLIANGYKVTIAENGEFSMTIEINTCEDDF